VTPETAGPTVAAASAFRGESLVFILSQHRSGSTLLQRILGGHSQILTGAETFLLLHPLYALKTTGFRAEYREWEARVAVGDYLEHYAEGEQTYVDALRAMAAVLYGAALARAGTRYFLDKTPRYTNIIPELHRVLPDAHYVVLLRNPLAILASQLERLPKPTTFQNLTLLRNETVLAPPRLLAGIDLFGPRATLVHYEDLVTDPDRVIGRLCDRLGLDPEPGMVDYGGRPDPPGRGGFWDKRGIPHHDRPTTESLEKWRTLGDDPQRRHIARSFLFELGPEVVRRLGYDFDELVAAVAPTDAGDAGVVCAWDALMVPAPHADDYLDAFPGTADYPPSPPLTRTMPVTPSRISVVVPTTGGPERLERAIRSVVLQSRPNVELVVAPDATAPDCAEVLARFEPWLAAVADPAPGGFADALARGLAATTGEVLTWLRPDEEHLSWTLGTVGAIFGHRRDVEWLLGGGHFALDAAGAPIAQVGAPTSLADWLRSPGADRRLEPLRFGFVRRTLLHRSGATVDPTLVDAPDVELALRLAAHARPVLAPVPLGGVVPSPWWRAARFADDADELLATVDPAALPATPFAHVHRGADATRWRDTEATRGPS
jgi:hypothetical protein